MPATASAFTPAAVRVWTRHRIAGEGCFVRALHLCPVDELERFAPVPCRPLPLDDPPS